MRTIDILDDLYDSGKMRLLVQHGLLSINLDQWRKIYKAHESRIKTGSKPYQAVKDISDLFEVSEKTVYRILEKMNYSTDGSTNKSNS